MGYEQDDKIVVTKLVYSYRKRTFRISAYLFGETDLLIRYIIHHSIIPSKDSVVD